ncbi:uncharacterized protein N7479_004252 [Penicillium vulpinum]|uniref:Uncharacterized protein n=1 Tax=Penicillium vulpinum TaxID=29845 RepID=A0A1V6SD01_9EURO|nr:uncharacterized protein N7479_004252 [Penicillium vulpinum]KAJ5964376.1 hypothetical protein N7479_004252 [Penicillium vulpinum]OQE11619.1 hypothetical protein PENVUL_c002G07137 [Penicillium vulpinum]
MSREEKEIPDYLLNPETPGSTWAHECEFVPQSRIQELALHGRFRKFGVCFWGPDTMTCLGIMVKRMASDRAKIDVVFRWTSLMQNADYLALKRPLKQWAVPYPSKSRPMLADKTIKWATIAELDQFATSVAWVRRNHRRAQSAESTPSDELASDQSEKPDLEATPWIRRTNRPTR